MELKVNHFDSNCFDFEPFPFFSYTLLCGWITNLALLCQLRGRVARSMVSVNHWLSWIKTYRLSWYLTSVSTNHASSNSVLNEKEKPKRTLLLARAYFPAGDAGLMS